MAIDEDITLKKLEVFQSFMTLGNMARVSEALGQSTVSVHRALHSLEEGLRCPLFKRDGRKLIPLSTAYVFAEHVERILAECEAGVRRTREAAGFSSTTLKIGGLYSMTVGTLPRIFAGLKTRRSALDIELTLGSNRSLLAKLEDGQLDAIVIALGEPLRNPDLLTVPMFADEILFAAPLASPYASSAEIDLQTVRSEKFVALGDDFATYHDFMAAFDKAGFAPQIALRVGDIFSLMNLVSGGIGYALLPRRVADFSPRVQLIPLAARYAISQHIVLVMQRNRERDPNLLALSAECRLLGGKAAG
ncbi:LysR substrate-binding domain-containing protein [Ralstonia sp. SET104]|uniref:LysR substrate-binding domain-containing protein n=1 Tax=Ralstonia sp. SET104 TaxID=2448774 RepID=UPI000F56E9EE|nr:LysR substrate-binding domain-containing protein [Ralstonia sp. SET104]GCB02496.1 transcriptional regulator [Ralstonia sp. SET104]